MVEEGVTLAAVDGAVVDAVAEVGLAARVNVKVHAELERLGLGLLGALLPVDGQVRRRVHPQQARAVVDRAERGRLFFGRMYWSV